MDPLSLTQEYIKRKDFLGLNDYLLSQDGFDEDTLKKLISLLQSELERISQDNFDLRQNMLKMLVLTGVHLHNKDPIVASPFIHTILEQLTELGKSFFVSSNYFRAEQVFASVYELSVRLSSSSFKKYSGKYLVLSQLGYLSDLTRAANMYRYFGDKERAIGLAWRALLLSLDIIIRTNKFGLDLVSIVREIKLHFFICQTILLEINDDTQAVVELKLNELYQIYELLSDDIPDTNEQISLWVATHRESLQYLIPQDPPSLLVITSDGRVVHYANITAELDQNVEPFAHLVGGVLTAINSIFVEEYRRLGGAIREIVTAEKIIYIANRKFLNVAIFCDFLTETLIKFSENLADSLEQKSNKLLINWRGDEKTILPIKEFINQQILSLLSG